jgi:AdoMet-dependent heme synthase
MRTFPDALKFCLSAALSALAGKRYLSCLWELTYRCTARCRICRYWKYQSNEAEELSLFQIKNGLDRIFEYGCRLVNFTGGEPTLRTDLEQIVAYASRLGIWTSVVTNGSLLTRDRVRGLREMGLDNLLVSLDSTIPDFHDAQRGLPGSYAQAVQCMDWISNDFLRGHRTGGIMCVISRQNMRTLSELIEFAREHGVYILFQPYHSNKTGDPEPVPEIGDREIRQIIEWNNERMIVLNSKSYLLGMESNRSRSNHARCHAGQKYFSIDPFGFLHPCVDMPSAGHILNNDITAVMSGKSLEMVSHCRGCWYCFRGEADTSLSLKGCFEKARLGFAVYRQNAARRG